MIMVLTLLPAESRIAEKLSDFTSENSVLAAAVGKISDFTVSEEKGEEGAKDISESSESEKDGEKEEEKLQIVLTDYEEDGAEQEQQEETAETADAQTANLVSETKLSDVSDKKGSGNIIIYHTHATESYLPVASFQCSHHRAGFNSTGSGRNTENTAGGSRIQRRPRYGHSTIIRPIINRITVPWRR